MIQQAVILVGGFGTRLQSVVQDVPKPMAPVAGKPFLEYQLAALRRGGIEQIVFCAGYRAESVQTYFGNGSRFGLRIEYSVETMPLGTAGALKYAGPMLHDSFFVLNGDTYLELDYHGMAQMHHDKGALATLAVWASALTQPYGSIVIDADGRIRAFSEKSEGDTGSAWINGGVYVFDKRVLDHIPQGRAVSIEKETFPQLLASEAPLYGFPTAGYFIDIGTPSSYLQFVQDIEKGLIHVNPQQSSTAN